MEEDILSRVTGGNSSSSVGSRSLTHFFWPFLTEDRSTILARENVEPEHTFVLFKNDESTEISEPGEVDEIG